VIDTLRWARFLVMYDGFGDKEFLFHPFLAPFTVWLDPAIGGRLALALANAVFVALFVRLSYTAFHVVLGLAVLRMLIARWLERRWSPSLVLAPLLGSIAGLLLHPHFPKSLEIWWIHNVRFFELKGELDVGPEPVSSPMFPSRSVSGWPATTSPSIGWSGLRCCESCLAR
jgi:hypothetical protein